MYSCIVNTYLFYLDITLYIYLLIIKYKINKIKNQIVYFRKSFLLLQCNTLTELQDLKLHFLITKN